MTEIQAAARSLPAANGSYSCSFSTDDGSEVRRRQHATQTDLAKVMGVTQARVSRIEKGELVRSAVDTLAAYVQALGGKLQIIADFGDESYVWG